MSGLKARSLEKDCLKGKEIARYGKFRFSFEKPPVTRETSGGEPLLTAKGSLRQQLSYWRGTLKAGLRIENILSEGYRVPFVNKPPAAAFSNNASAFQQKLFVNEEVSRLLLAGYVREGKSPPRVVNPLTVATNTDGQHRLILDLRHVNAHIPTHHIKYDDWRVFSQFLVTEGWCYKFDLKHAYHHVDLHPEVHTYFGFSWWPEGKEIFRFHCLGVWPCACTLYFYQGGQATSETLESTGYKNCREP